MVAASTGKRMDADVASDSSESIVASPSDSMAIVTGTIVSMRSLPHLPRGYVQGCLDELHCTCYHLHRQAFLTSVL